MSTGERYKAEQAGFLKAFGANVRRIRESLAPAMSQEALASVTRLHRTEIGKIEQGAVNPHLTTLVILADGLKVSVDDLVVGLPVPQERKPRSWEQVPRPRKDPKG